MSGGLVFAAIAPHGHLAIPEACAEDERGLATGTQRAMAELGRRFVEAPPEVTIVFTPHNVHVAGHLAVVVAGKLAGSLSRWTQASIELQCTTDRDLAAARIGAFHGAGLPAVGVSYGGNEPATATAALDWRALIPLWFMGGRAQLPVPVVVVCPARELSAEAYVRAGRVIAVLAAASGKRVALIASSDHGHRHRADGPYGSDPAAHDYDRRIVDLVRENRLAGLLDLDPALVSAAVADSYWQMLILHGALGMSWRGELLSYEAPTYFGMLCASYAPA